MKFGYCEFIDSLLLASLWLSYATQACPPGYADCPFYGCSPGQCPQPCVSIIDKNSCSNTGVGNKRCTWNNSYCGEDISCSVTSNGCSSGCMLCENFGCLPQGLTCPQRCDLYALEEQCNTSPIYGTTTCGWSGGKCIMAQHTTPQANNTRHENDTTPTPTSGTRAESPTPTETRPETTASQTSSTKTSATKTSSSSTSSSTILSGSSESTVNINTTDAGYIGMIVGIVLGVIGLIGILVVLVHRYRQKLRAQQNQDDLGYRTTGTTPLLDRPNSFLNALKSIMDNDINLTKMRTPTTMTSPQ